MKKYSRIFSYLGGHKDKIALYFLFILLSIIFSIVSIGMLMPFLQLIFTNPDPKCLDCSTISKTNSNPAIQFINSWLFNSIDKKGKLPTLAIICVLMMLFVLLKNLFLYLSFYVLNPLKNRVINHLREEIYHKILKLPIGYFTEKRKGDIMSRFTNDIYEVETSVVGALEGWIKEPLTIIFTLATLFFISPLLTGFLLLLIPLMGLVIGRITKSLKRQSHAVAEKNGEMMSTIDETLGGLRVIKAFNAEDLLRGKFDEQNQSVLSTRISIMQRRDLASPASEVMGIALFCAILGFGGWLVLSQKIDLDGAAFLGYLGLFYMIINPVKSLSSLFGNMQKGAAAIGRIEEVLKAPIVVDDNVNGKQMGDFENGIVFKNVGFKYEDVEILKNINLSIKKGKTIALVGSSGAGKSTLADLIPRFHDVTSGELLVDSINIRDYSLRSLRNHISIVTQEPILFNSSIAENIALGMNNATQHEIEQAAKIANAHEFIIKKEKGYQTNIGDRGMKLSGGERQRLTIARAVLKNPPILILDEATSSLDTESERLVQDAINNLMTNRTSIVIAHRLSTIRHADEIIVLQKGEIVERGNHDDLIAQNGFYKRLVDMQEVK
ncbi:MAG: ABC transporter ATP-binding protein [Ferruginibacter sp.]